MNRAAAPPLDLLGRDANRELLALNRACPIEADFTFYFDRGRDFFAWPDRVFDAHWYAAIRDAGRLVGYCMAGLRHGWTGADWGTWFYLGDARILPDCRGGGLARQTALKFEGMMREHGLGIAVVKKGNAPADRIVRTAEPDLFVRRKLCDFEVCNVPLLLAPRMPGGLKVRRARWSDAAAVIDLMGRAYDHRLLAPRVNEEWIRWAWGRPGCGPEDHMLAERGGRLVGVAGFWDLGPMRRTRVLAYPPRVALLRILYTVARRLPAVSAPALPRVGESFRSVTAVNVAVEENDPSVLRALVATAMRAYRARGYHLLHLGFAAGDPLRSAMNGVLRQRFASDIHVFVRPDHASSMTGGVPFIDLAML